MPEKSAKPSLQRSRSLSKQSRTRRVLRREPPSEPSPLHPTKNAHRYKYGQLDIRRIITQNRIRSTMTGTRNIDEAVHKLNLWLKELMQEMNWDNRERALSAYRATLHALRDILPPQGIFHLGSQLPLILKGIYFDGLIWRGRPLCDIRHADEFYELVREELGRGGMKYGNDIIRKFANAIFGTMVRHMGENELRKVKGLMRIGVREILPVSLDPTVSRYIPKGEAHAGEKDDREGEAKEARRESANHPGRRIRPRRNGAPTRRQTRSSIR